jgi:hypothetical protein
MRDRENYMHFTVIHSHTFGESLRTTNSIESFCRKLKALANFDKGLHPTSIEEVYLF